MPFSRLSFCRSRITSHFFPVLSPRPAARSRRLPSSRTPSVSDTHTEAHIESHLMRLMIITAMMTVITTAAIPFSLPSSDVYELSLQFCPSLLLRPSTLAVCSASCVPQIRSDTPKYTFRSANSAFSPRPVSCLRLSLPLPPSLRLCCVLVSESDACAPLLSLQQLMDHERETSNSNTDHPLPLLLCLCV